MSQQQAPPTLAPGNPIGYAPIYGPPPLAQDTGTLAPPSGNVGTRWIDGLLLGGLVGGAIFALTTWGILDNLYSGADIRALERAAEAANATAQAVEQRAANAEANAQEWRQHSQVQGQTIDGVRELVCR
jgi:hypothetical protein